jgi:LPXTG-site transpeptidase (sortase) family protein
MRAATLGRATVVMIAICVVLAAAGCDRGRKPAATPDGGAVAPVRATPAGPLAGIAIPAPASPQPAADTTQTQTQAEPGLPAPSDGALLARIVIPKAKVDHRPVVKGLTERREMEEPGGKDELAWYNFSALPGYGSNAVFSGHVDWHTGERGVFWFLRDLKEGDAVEVHYSDGLVLQYRVNRVAVYGTADAPVAEITGPTTNDTLTMITCDGVFSRLTRDYDKRRVVFAERIA